LRSGAIQCLRKKKNGSTHTHTQRERERERAISNIQNKDRSARTECLDLVVSKLTFHYDD